MFLKYQPAFENPLAMAVTLFLSLCSVFALAVALLNFGRYGYVPEWSFYWSLYALVIHWNTYVKLEQAEGKWHYKITAFNLPLRSLVFDELAIATDGKYSHVVGVTADSNMHTWITGDKEYRDTALAFIKPEVKCEAHEVNCE